MKSSHKRLRFVRFVKGVSSVVAVLLMIAIAVIASVVAYAWVMGYFKTGSTKISNALQVQSATYTGNDTGQGNWLYVYVQNVGKGKATLIPNQCLYVGGALQGYANIINPPITPCILQESGTAVVVDQISLSMGKTYLLKVVTHEGTSVEYYFTLNKFEGQTPVIPGTLATFTFGAISPQTAGAGFSVTITAVTANGNTVTSYTGPATLTDTSGSVSPTSTGAFVNGVCTVPVTVTKATTSDVIKATDPTTGKIGSSSSFIVSSLATATSFSFSVIGSQVAGTSFSVTISAVDQYGNTVTSYAGTATLVDTSGSMTPTSATFSAGVFTVSVTVTKATTSDVITATDSANGLTGSSGSFIVSSLATATSFSFSVIGSQVAGTSFSVTIAAVDQYDNTITSYAGTATLSDLSGSMNPGTATFTAGVWTDQMTITKAYTDDIITAADSNSGLTGQSNTFNVNLGPLASFTISGCPSSLTAGQSFGSNNVVVTAYDAYGNVKTDYTGSVWFTSTDPQATLPYTNALLSYTFTAGDNGVHTFPGVGFTLHTAGSQTITVTDGTTSKVSSSIIVGVGSFVFSDISSPQTAGSAFSITITATDQYSNVMTNYAGSASLSDLSGSISPGTATFTGGVCTVSVTITKAYAGDVITATDSADDLTGSSGSFTVSSLAIATSFSFSTIGSQVAGTSFSVTISAVDQYGNTVTSYAGTATLVDTSGSMNPISATFAAGVCTVSVTITKAQVNDVITASDSSSSLTGQSDQFTVSPSAVGSFVFTTIGQQTAGSAFSVTITATDQYGNVMTNYAGTATLADDTSGSMSPTSTGAFANGVGTVSVTITKAYTGDVITATDSSSGLSGQSNTFNVNPGALASFTFGTINSPQSGGTAFSITITAQDAYGNTATSFTGSASLSDLSGSLTPTSTGAFAAGVWTGNVKVNTIYTNDVITATSSGATGQSNTFNVGLGSLDHFVFNNVGTQTAGAAFSITLTAEDAGGNIIMNYAGTAAFTDLSGTIYLVTSGVFVNGIWTGTASITKAYTNDVITATDSVTGATGQSNTFTVNAGPATQLKFTAGASQSITVSTVSSPITVTLEDQYGEPTLAGSGGVVVSLATSTTTGTFWSNSGGTTKITSITIPSGSSSASFYYSDTASGLATLTASSGSLSPATTTFTLSGNKLVFTTGASQSLAPGETSTAIVISQETPTGGADYNIFSTTTIQLTSSSPTGKFVNSGGTQIYSVTVTYLAYQSSTFYYVDTSPGTPTLEGYAGGFTPAYTVFTIYTPVVSSFKVTASGGGNIGTQAVGKAFSITITAIDQQGNTMTSYTGPNTLSASTGSISPTSTGAFTNGVWTGSVSLDTAGSITISTSGGGATGTSNTFTVYTPALTKFNVTASSYSQTAGTPFTITITAVDQQGNTYTGYTGTNTLTDTSGTISPGTTGTFANGVCQFSVTITKAGSDTISTSGGGATGTSNTFTISAGSLSKFVFNTISSPQTAHSNFAITITAEDAYGNTVTSYGSSTALTETGGGAGGTVSPASVTFTNGVYTGNVYVTKSGTGVTITATRTTTSSASNTFTVNPGAFDHFTITAPGGGDIGTQNSGANFNIVITAVDQDGNTVTSYNTPQTLAVNFNSGSGTLTAPSITFANGVWTGQVSIYNSSSSSNRSVYLYITGYRNNDNSNTFTVNHH